jgi:hypothetical protein
MVAHTCNPSYSGGGDRRISIQNQPRQSYHETLPEKQTKAEIGKHEALTSIPSTTEIKNIIKKKSLQPKPTTLSFK